MCRPRYANCKYSLGREEWGCNSAGEGAGLNTALFYFFLKINLTIDTELNNINPFLFSNLASVRLERAVEWTVFISLVTNEPN